MPFDFALNATGVRSPALIAWDNQIQDNHYRLKAEFFQALAHTTRITVVELLSDEREVPVSQICDHLGLEQTNVSQHLAVLRSQQIVKWRKDGSKALYSLRDRMLVRILDLMQEYFQDHQEDLLKLLEWLEKG